MLPSGQGEAGGGCRRAATPHAVRPAHAFPVRPAISRPLRRAIRSSRDGAYHQGTVWPWLLGPFLTAYLEVNDRSAEARRQAALWLAEFRRYIEDEGVGQIPEVFDGDAPHRAGGCIAQAWSVAELLRTAITVRDC